MLKPPDTITTRTVAGGDGNLGLHRAASASTGISMSVKPAARWIGTTSNPDKDQAQHRRPQ
jgi:hypothetical protein